jgi:hypothetical protein
MSYCSFKTRLRQIAFESDLEATRFFLALGAIFVGLGFAWPVDTFPTIEQIANGTGRHTYAIMAIIMPEAMWATCFIVQGAIALFSLLTQTRNRLLFMVDALFGALLWTVSILSCYLAYWRGFDRLWEYRPPAIMGLEVAGVLASLWIVVRYTWGKEANGR